MSYASLAKFAQQGGTIYFFLIFLAALAYALWPRKQAEFDKAARAALEPEDHP